MFSSRGCLLSLLTLFAPLSATVTATANSWLDSRSGNSKPFCKAVSGSPDWPSPSTWKRLNDSLAGRLLNPSPPGAVCHPHPGQSGSSYNNTQECARVRGAWSTYEFHASDPVSTEWNHWNGDTCLPEQDYPCSPQGYPLFVVNATTARHVQLGVQFAKKHNMRLVVHSTGHDFLGRSNAPNSLSIWVHHLKGFQPNGDSFRPKGCKKPVVVEGTSVTVGGGSQMMDLYTALDALNQTIVGGGGKTVSVGGYLTGGGHSLLSARHGLGADQVLEMEVVTPSGEIVVANECQNQDIFFAMRGGGGSTFAILTSVTLRTFPTPSITTATIGLVTLDPLSSSVFPMIAYILSHFPRLADSSGLSGYAFLIPPNTPYDLGGNNPNPIGDPDPTDPDSPQNTTTLIGGIVMICTLQDSSISDLTSIWQPILDYASQTLFPQAGFIKVLEPKQHPSFLSWFQENHDRSPAGINIFIGSRLLPASSLTLGLSPSPEVSFPDSTAEINSTLQILTEKGKLYERYASSAGILSTAHLVSSRGLHKAKPRGGQSSVAVSPAWRKAYVHAICTESFLPLNLTSKYEALAKVEERVDALRELAPGSGAYVNEASPMEPNWQREFWGDNYDRLKRIKRTLDPTDVLWCNSCVGNERWQETGDRLCRV
ncbi:hypothetical protein QBC35DRAFT_499164 [Podospora australis]|uniref:FAD-binding PCMH-type domain-containing protein n=1 Tax=Podospora australis TaxID=1536484 RepID=A0AAN6WVK3_9PEZI|nr:hypothetical protein QBC35DRAFT_499164 [Podospora australis]